MSHYRNPDWAWQTLGIARTVDVTEIRRAYARRLKAIDADADPQAFIELREALGLAIYDAQQQAQPARTLEPALGGTGADEAAGAEERLDAGFDAPAAERDAEAPTTPGGSDAAEAVPVEGPHARFQRLEGLLFADGDATSDPEALVAAVLAILDDPDMVHIDHEASVQRWLADQLARSIPRCDPVVPLVVDRFGWEKHAGQLAQPWAFDVLVERRRELATPRHVTETAASLDNSAKVEALPDEASGAGDPERRVPVAASGDESKPDPALFSRIEALLFGPATGDPAAELARLAEALLTHPSIERIQVSDMVERWLADIIAKGSPRSDPMLDIASSHFRWQDRLGDWHTSPLLHWLVDRQIDAEHERYLTARLPHLQAVLDALRGPGEPPSPREAWRLLPDMRAFMEYAGAHLPTSLSVCNPATVEWWNDYMREMPRLRRERDALRRMFRGHRSIEGQLGPHKRDIGLGLFFGIMVMPFLFAWLTLRRGHGLLARSVSLVWLAICTLALVMGGPPPADGPDARLYGLPNPSLVNTPYRTAEADLNPLLEGVSEGRLDLAALQTQNPELHSMLVGWWGSQRRVNAPKQLYVNEVVEMLDEVYRRGIRAGSFELQTAYWRLYSAKLSWLRTSAAGRDGCGRFLDGDRQLRATFPPGLLDRERALLTQTLLATVPAGQAEPSQRTFDMPPLLLDATSRRSGLNMELIMRALRGGATPAERCDVRIAVIETALKMPQEEVEQFFREMSASL